jgi:internalin A
MSVAEAWGVIHGWIDQHCPAMRRHLNGPADPAALDALEQELGIPLPDDFRASYLIHDGSARVPGPPRIGCTDEFRILVGLPLLPLSEVVRCWRNWAGYAADEDLLADLNGDYTSSPTGAVRETYARRGWLPFAGGEDHYVAVDFDPGPSGASGQVINFGRDDHVRHVIAPTFAEFMSFVAELFSAGEVMPDPDHRPGRPVPVCLRGTGRDLLRSLPEVLGRRR